MWLSQVHIASHARYRTLRTPCSSPAPPSAAENMEYGTCGTAENQHKKPSVYKVHAALVAGYCLFAGGAIIGKFGVHDTSAIIFELIREMLSVIALAVGLYIFGVKPLPAREDIPQLLLAGVAFFFNQIFWFVALKLADPVTGSAWQTFLPILTALLAVILGQTKLEGMKAIGILISTLGAAFMVVFDSRPSKAVTSDQGLLVRAVSHLMFFGNIAGTAGYFIIMNRFGNRYTPVQTLTWSICTSLALLAVTAILMFTFRPLHQVLCHDDTQFLIDRCMNQGMWLPTTVYFPLFYEVVICTLVAWPLLNWANQHTDPAVVSVYMGLHPAAVTVICMAIVGVMGAPWAHQFHIGMPRLKDFGIVGIVLGLTVVFHCELKVTKKTTLQDKHSKSKV
ncbi:unnamed protein product [Prorocentrum cordatum]|uniref:EamA domain-containing protein n=1 Tax=Prorocentrum cordatum TaxID=2364126 RepID=A0ABN9UHM8_9DINO|nr:unnamed protein product [Polarella glacialis]